VPVALTKGGKMIDLRSEQLLRLSEVPTNLPKRPNGNRLHISAVYRWAQRGVGGVKLETVKIGGTTYTSLEAIQRFADARSNTTDNQGASEQQPKQRRRKQERARRRVEETLRRRR